MTNFSLKSSKSKYSGIKYIKYIKYSGIMPLACLYVFKTKKIKRNYIFSRKVYSGGR